MTPRVSSTTSSWRPKPSGTALRARCIEAACDWFRSVGAPRVVLWTAEKNEGGAAALRASRVPPDDDRDDQRASRALKMRNWNASGKHRGVRRSVAAVVVTCGLAVVASIEGAQRGISFKPVKHSQIDVRFAPGCSRGRV